jgi:hypothetical protein
MCPINFVPGTLQGRFSVFMTTSLDQLPFDILFCVAWNLELEDVVHLGQTCRQLKALLDERSLCRRTVEVSRCIAAVALTSKADGADRSITHTPKKLDSHEKKKSPTSKLSRRFTTEDMHYQLHTPLLREF